MSPIPDAAAPRVRVLRAFTSLCAGPSWTQSDPPGRSRTLPDAAGPSRTQPAPPGRPWTQQLQRPSVGGFSRFSPRTLQDAAGPSRTQQLQRPSAEGLSRFSPGTPPDTAGPRPPRIAMPTSSPPHAQPGHLGPHEGVSRPPVEDPIPRRDTCMGRPQEEREPVLTVTRTQLNQIVAEALAAQRGRTPVNQTPGILGFSYAHTSGGEIDAASAYPESEMRSRRDPMLERLASQVRELQARADGKKPVEYRAHPFTQDVLNAYLPPGFKESGLAYEGTTDPSRHLMSFENIVVLHQYSDPIRCRAFLATLRGSAQDWFHQLPPGSISDFESFSTRFMNHFASAKAHEKTYLVVFNLYKREGESLRSYVARYTRTCVDVPSASEEIKSGGLTHGLRPGLCRNSLVKKPARTYDEVLRRCAKYTDLEESEADFFHPSRVEDNRKERDDRRPNPPPENRRQGRKEEGWPPRPPGGRRPENERWQPRPFGPMGEHGEGVYTPLTVRPERVLEVMEGKAMDRTVAWPQTRKDGPTRPRSSMYCLFHRDYGHNTVDTSGTK